MLSAEEVENLVSYSCLMDVSEHLSFAVRRSFFFFFRSWALSQTLCVWSLVGDEQDPSLIKVAAFYIHALILNPPAAAQPVIAAAVR